jgi:hypothetical protein
MALAEYLRTKGPSEALSQLVFTSRPVTESVCQSLELPVAEVKNPTQATISRVLWKFGFDIPRYDEVLERFRLRLERMNEAALSFAPEQGEDAREALRSAGVNLFISVEEFLEEFIAFNIWLLASDHFVATRFKYRPSEARQIVSEILGEMLSTEYGEFRWQPIGGNTLGVLLQYLSAAARWTLSLVAPEAPDRISLQRPQEQLPHYAENPNKRFPFRHKQLWADCDPDELRRHIQGFDRICKLFSQANLASVRNGLEHKRDEERFPTSDAILACVARLREALELADAQRYYPKTFWLYEVTSDRFGAKKFSLQDYRHKALIISGPTIAAGLQGIGYSDALVVAPTNLLGLPNSLLRFTVAKRSEYSEYWANYPRRRKLPLQEAEQAPSEALVDASAVPPSSPSPSP